MPTIYSSTITPVYDTNNNLLSDVACAVTDAPGYGGVNQLSDWPAYVQLGNQNAALSSGSLNFYVRKDTAYTYLIPGSNPPAYNTTYGSNWYKIALEVDRVNLTSISLDSRRVFGKANIDGELPGDPNADLTTNVFQPWIFHGGHFVGNLSYSSANDQSGTARTQLQLTTAGDATTYLYACLTCFDTGARMLHGGSSVSSGTIGLFRPSSSDTYISQGLNANWTRRWTVNPGGTQTAAGDFINAPYYTVAPGSTDVDNFLNWQTPPVSEVWQTAYGGDGNNTHNSMWSNFALCQTDETAQTWQYFGSTWLEAVSGQVYPYTDSQPRVWKVKYP